MPPTAPPPVRVTALAHGGEGVAMLPSGKKIFVPFVAPGDLVEVAVEQEKPRFARGRLVRVVEAGADRVAPRCRHAGRCGGCQLQQVAPAAQLAAKEAAFYASLARLGGVPREALAAPRPIVASPAAFGYRARCRLRVAGATLGFCGWRSRVVVPLEECPVLVAPLERLVRAAAAALAATPLDAARDLHLCVGEAPDGAAGPGAPAPAADGAAGPGAGALFVAGSAAAAAAAAERLLAAVPGLRGLVVHGEHGAPVTLGDPRLVAAAPRAAGARLGLRPDLFAQANPAANDLLVGLVVELLAPAPTDVVLDLYAGAGNFTFALLARAARAIAVEESRGSLALAAETAAAAGLADRLTAIPGDAVAACDRLAAAGERVDVALMDPPRVGARETPAALARLAPRRIAYVSCDPATLARDVRAFVGLGYRPTTAVPVDMFPQTYHVEGVVLLERG